MLTQAINSGISRPPAAERSEAPPAPVERPREQLSVHEAIAIANKAIRSLSNGLEFSLDAESGKMVVRVVDRETQQVIRQIPSEEMLAIARALDQMQGTLINREA